MNTSKLKKDETPSSLSFQQRFSDSSPNIIFSLIIPADYFHWMQDDERASSLSSITQINFYPRLTC